ncbi:ABC-type oligopeptide transport system%2C periplasmic component [Salmonella enterica subsp. enterica serovar Bovismorbificans]|nr:ABC-type oligopeptide transport system%2C periplasmic component [Salmonella enterica subsp. enterica serovar Bovismorbificans]
MRQHFTEVFNTGRRQRADWTRRDGVDANAFRSHSVCHITHVGFQRGFRQTHDIVVRDGALRSQIRQGQQRRTRIQHGAAGFRHGNKAVRANIVSDFKAFAGNRINIIAVQLIARRETDRVYKTVKFRPNVTQLCKHSVNAGIFSDITR